MLIRFGLRTSIQSTALASHVRKGRADLAAKEIVSEPPVKAATLTAATLARLDPTNQYHLGRALAQLQNDHEALQQ